MSKKGPAVRSQATLRLLLQGADSVSILDQISIADRDDFRLLRRSASLCTESDH